MLALVCLVKMCTRFSNLPNSSKCTKPVPFLLLTYSATPSAIQIRRGAFLPLCLYIRAHGEYIPHLLLETAKFNPCFHLFLRCSPRAKGLVALKYSFMYSSWSTHPTSQPTTHSNSMGSTSISMFSTKI